MADPSGVDSRVQWWQIFLGYLTLPHLPAILLVEAATAGFAVIAWGGLPPLDLLARLLLAMLGGQVAIGAVNEIIDLPDDRTGNPGKPLPSGTVSLHGARVMAGAGLVLMTLVGATLGLQSLALLALGTGLGLAYDLWFKRSRWSWAPYLLALPLLPIWVFVSLDRFDARLLLIYPLGALSAVGVHFAQALPDIESDRAAGLATPTTLLGEAPAFGLAWAAVLSAPLLGWSVAVGPGGGDGAGVMAIAAGCTAGLLLLNLAMFLVNRRAGIVACFPLTALALLASGLGWTISIVQ